MFGGEAVINCEHVNIGVAADQSARLIVGIKVANHETAAVKEDHQGAIRVSRGRGVVPSFELSDLSIDSEINNRAYRYGFSSGDCCGRLGVRALCRDTNVGAVRAKSSVERQNHRQMRI
jgi:hypothetical protein